MRGAGPALAHIGPGRAGEEPTAGEQHAAGAVGHLEGHIGEGLRAGVLEQDGASWRRMLLGHGEEFVGHDLTKPVLVVEYRRELIDGRGQRIALGLELDA